MWTHMASNPGIFIDFGHRMTVVRLPDDGLLVHSNTPLDPDMKAELQLLGTPLAFVCPCAFHDAFIDQAFGAFPGARVFAPPGVSDRWKDRPFDGVLTEVADPLWAGTLDQTLFDGGPRFREAVFFHHASRTLILADILANLDDTRPLLTRIYGHISGLRNRVGMSRILRLAVTNRAAARQSILRIQQWDFDRIILGHGPTIESGGAAVFRGAFRWLTA